MIWTQRASAGHAHAEQAEPSAFLQRQTAKKLISIDR